MDGVAFHDPMHEATKKPLTTVAACHCSPYSPGRQSRPHLFHVVRKVCTKSGHVSTIPPVVKNNSHHGISTIKSDYPKFQERFMGSCRHDPPSFECAAKRRIRFALIPPERAFKNDVRVKDDNAFCGAAKERRRRGFDPLDGGVKLGRKHGAGEGCGTSKEGKGFGRIGRSL